MKRSSGRANLARAMSSIARDGSATQKRDDPGSGPEPQTPSQGDHEQADRDERRERPEARQFGEPGPPEQGQTGQSGPHIAVQRDIRRRKADRDAVACGDEAHRPEHGRADPAGDAGRGRGRLGMVGRQWNILGGPRGHNTS